MYTQKDFSNLLGLPGFSDIMLNNHFTLYKGYVDNANKLVDLLEKVEKGSYEWNELKRRLGWELNGIKLHELYFENMQNKSSEEEKKFVAFENNINIKTKIEELYTSFEEYKNSLKRNAMIRGIGWVVLTEDRDTKKIFHTFIGDHNIGNVVDGKILLVMDVWEHAYMTDYGIKKADYINAFINAIDWSVVEKRYNNN